MSSGLGRNSRQTGTRPTQGGASPHSSTDGGEAQQPLWTVDNCQGREGCQFLNSHYNSHYLSFLTPTEAWYMLLNEFIQCYLSPGKGKHSFSKEHIMYESLPSEKANGDLHKLCTNELFQPPPENSLPRETQPEQLGHIISLDGLGKQKWLFFFLFQFIHQNADNPFKQEFLDRVGRHASYCAPI